MLSLHGSRSLDDDDEVAVIVDAARPAQVATMLVEAYGLTARQRDVLGRLLLGRSMTQVARELGISEHTANDHRKAIYARLGVTSRAELAARLQAEQYTPRTEAGLAPSPYGGYLGATADTGGDVGRIR
jgi:DNA-binding CsgD family transcriptional regulator